MAGSRIRLTAKLGEVDLAQKTLDGLNAQVPAIRATITDEQSKSDQAVKDASDAQAAAEAAFSAAQAGFSSQITRKHKR